MFDGIVVVVRRCFLCFVVDGVGCCGRFLLLVLLLYVRVFLFFGGAVCFSSCSALMVVVVAVVLHMFIIRGVC